MSGIAHSMRKRLSIATTRTKTVEKNISAEYKTQKHALLHGKETLEKAIAVVKQKAHSEFATSYKNFSELISSDAPADTNLFLKAREANETSNVIFTKAKSPLVQDGAPSRLLAHAEAYISELNTIEKKFPNVEGLFVEVSRYERKVGKLQDKSNNDKSQKSKSDKVADRARRNLDKLEAERASFNTELNSIIEMMKKSNAKYEKILDCVFTAFWISENEFLTSTLELTKTIREKSQQTETELVNLDVSKM